MSIDIVQRVIEDSRELYSLPQTLVEVLRVVKDDTASAGDMADVLKKDPPLTAKLLRIVNSPYYGVGREVGSVSQAVVTLGIRQVTALALSTSVYAMTENWQSTMDRIRFWRHSLEVAIASRTIAEKVGYGKLEEIFVAGLLHDLGLLIMENSFPTEFAQIWKQLPKHDSIVDLEESAWGTNHARVGQFLLEQWRLPDDICQAVGGHHTVFTPGAVDAEFKPTQIVALANHVSQFPIAEHQITPTTHGAETREIIRENLGLSSDALMMIEKHLFSQTVSESKYLDIDIGSPEDILVEANRLLFGQY
ncbi:HDOD domain-containing protein, partial [candidate division GN15 bacterium]|nr:HDOD domain-containing protein [candidate division GN15 bacterium]